MRTKREEWLFAEGMAEYNRIQIVQDGRFIGYLQKDGSVTKDEYEADWYRKGAGNALILGAFSRFKARMKPRLMELKSIDELDE